LFTLPRKPDFRNRAQQTIACSHFRGIQFQIQIVPSRIVASVTHPPPFFREQRCRQRVFVHDVILLVPKSHAFSCVFVSKSQAMNALLQFQAQMWQRTKRSVGSDAADERHG
jgi:hypothetical protein